jgi:hypothetical protein
MNVPNVLVITLEVSKGDTIVLTANLSGLRQITL